MSVLTVLVVVIFLGDLSDLSVNFGVLISSLPTTDNPLESPAL